MSKLVLTVLTSIIFVLLAIAIIFAGVSINKYNNISCKNDVDAENARNNIKVSLILQCIAVFFLIFMIIYVYFWRQRRIRGAMSSGMDMNSSKTYEYKV